MRTVMNSAKVNPRHQSCGAGFSGSPLTEGGVGLKPALTNDLRGPVHTPIFRFEHN